jgi:hypothetical protein
MVSDPLMVTTFGPVPVPGPPHAEMTSANASEAVKTAAVRFIGFLSFCDFTLVVARLTKPLKVAFGYESMTSVLLRFG